WDVFPVGGLVGVIVRVERCAGQGSAGEESTLRPGVGEDIDVGVVGGDCFSTGGAGDRSGVSTKLHLAGEDFLGTRLGFDKQHVVGGGAAELDAKAADVNFVHGGRRPRTCHIRAGAADDHAATVGSAN